HRGPAAKDNAQEERRPKARPRYSDKARKNARNRKDKAAAAEPEQQAEPEAAPAEEEHHQDAQHAAVEEAERVPDPEEQRADGQAEETESWDTLFNDEGDCLDPYLMEELAVKEGRKKKSIQDPQFDYYRMDREFEEDVDLREDELSHIVEIYDFPADFKTEDLLKLFQCSRGGFDIKWVDDTHALGLFSSPVAAREALRSKHQLMKVRPLNKSSPATKAKARECSFLLPPKERPQTSAALARQLVIGALGVKSNVTKEQREVERRKLQEAKLKRMAARQREDAWEGK
uniref:R3H domain and coiled-coil containing 1-like n=1 Tax=Oryzias latipes TaxID=8090 RepID=H2M786_ORYLA